MEVRTKTVRETLNDRNYHRKHSLYKKLINYAKHIIIIYHCHCKRIIC